MPVTLCFIKISTRLWNIRYRWKHTSPDCFKSGMADTGIRGHRSGHADALPPVRGLPARDTGRTQKLYNLLPVRQQPYQFREQKFPLAELVYWQQYGITPELLERYKVCSLREYNSETAEGKPSIQAHRPAL